MSDSPPLDIRHRIVRQALLLEILQRAAALTELHQRVAEVVRGIRLREAASPAQLPDGVLQQRQRRRVLALLHQRVRPVVLVDGIAADGPRRRGGACGCGGARRCRRRARCR